MSMILLALCIFCCVISSVTSEKSTLLSKMNLHNIARFQKMSGENRMGSPSPGDNNDVIQMHAEGEISDEESSDNGLAQNDARHHISSKIHHRGNSIYRNSGQY